MCEKEEEPGLKNISLASFIIIIIIESAEMVQRSMFSYNFCFIIIFMNSVALINQ